MIQLKESLDQRMGCVIVGPSGCGKTALWRVLRSAMEKGGQRVVVHVMNPKSMPRSRLLGEMDPDTRDWMDGVLTAAARQVCCGLLSPVLRPSSLTNGFPWHGRW